MDALRLYERLIRLTPSQPLVLWHLGGGIDDKNIFWWKVSMKRATPPLDLADFCEKKNDFHFEKLKIHCRKSAEGPGLRWRWGHQCEKISLHFGTNWTI